MNLDHLIPFATERQVELLASVKEHGSARAAADQLGIHHSGISRNIQSLESLAEIAARRGKAPGHFNSGTAPGRNPPPK